MIILSNYNNIIVLLYYPNNQLDLQGVRLDGPRLAQEGPHDQVRVHGELHPGLRGREGLLEQGQIFRSQVLEDPLDLLDQVGLFGQLHHDRRLDELRGARPTRGPSDLFVGVLGLEELDPEVRGRRESLFGDEGLEEGIVHHEVLRVDIGTVPIDELRDEALVPGVEEHRVELREGPHGPVGHLGRVPLHRFGHEVRKEDLLASLAHDARCLHDALQHFDLVGPLVFVLVLVAPEGDVDQEALVDVLGEDPPPMPVLDDILQGLVVHEERPKVPGWGPTAALDDPEGEVQVGPGEGAVEGLAVVNGGQQVLALREAVVVLEEPLLALLREVLDTDAHLGPGPVEPLDEEPLENIRMDVLDVRRSTVTVQGGHEDRTRIQLLRVLELDPLVEHLFHPLCQLAALALVDVLAGLGGPEVQRHR